MKESKYAIVADDESLVRDSSTNAILNTNNKALQEYRKKRNLDKSLREDVEKLKTDISTIKDMLSQLLGRNDP